MDQNLITLLGILLLSIILLIVALPLKNYLEIKNIQKKDEFGMRWVKQLPGKEVYMNQNPENRSEIKCMYCGSARQYPSLEMVIKNKPTFGIINNSFDKFAHFKTYICTGCGSQLYRERYEN